MDQVTMYRETMRRFAKKPEWPISELITEPLPATSGRAEGQRRRTGEGKTPFTADDETLGRPVDETPWRLVNADVLTVMAKLPGRVGVMNFASPTRPGGGVELGAQAQEEAIAKGTYLVPALEQFCATYYEVNRAHPNRGLFSPWLIYSAGVRQVFSGTGAPVADHQVDIVTVAAPDRRRGHLSDAEALADIEFKISQTLRAMKKHGVTTPILGAFGSGVFGNPPREVGRLFAQQLARPEFAGVFETIWFAVYDRRGTVLPLFVAGLGRDLKEETI
ncbi:TIGR02452 family protein [Lacticaseibacillus yichunensis]|uniref:TIGR02452 family protein n=1 Tax=Lacticaseibacillus yichunensis TaxID=2486015 RepID=A0ABW4CJQ5_9LACO|nr:TIGR02452 family protein [Lacticaseibacillus yichunensis]